MRMRSLPGLRSLGFRRLPLAVLLSAGVALSPMPSLAQTPPKGQPGAPPEAMEPPSENPVPPADPGDGKTDPKQPLTEQLKEGDGVLEPPRSIDPGIKQPVPDDFESKTPVIRPPEEGKDADEPEEAPKPK